MFNRLIDHIEIQFEFYFFGGAKTFHSGNFACN